LINKKKEIKRRERIAEFLIQIVPSFLKIYSFYKMNELSHQVFHEQWHAQKHVIVKQDEIIDQLIIIASGQVQISKTIVYSDANGILQRRSIQLLNLNKGDIISGECLNLESEEDKSVIKSSYTY